MLPDASSQQLGWITTAAEFLILAAGVPVGYLVERYGTRLVIAPFATISVAALILLSLCTQYWQVLLCQGVLFGIGCSGAVLPSIVCVTQWFSTRKGLAVGLASSGSSIGGIFFTIMVTNILAAQGFAAAVRWSTLVVGSCMAIGAVCCEGPFPSERARQKAQKKAEQESSDAELAIAAPTEESAPDSRDRWASLRHNGAAWAAFCLGAFFCMMTQMVPFNYLPQMAASSGMSVVLAQYTTAVANGGSTIGRVIPGILSDYMGQFNVMIMVIFMSAVSILAVWLPVNYHPSDAGILFFSAFYGFVSGGYVSLLSPCVVALVDGRVADLNTKFGIACGFVALGYVFLICPTPLYAAPQSGVLYLCVANL
jgi:MFS transporter, MCT family, solute carrier family 16 (monocarboxylic acid transporters), member 10